MEVRILSSEEVARRRLVGRYGKSGEGTVEIAEFDGRFYRRRPNARHRNHRVYFTWRFNGTEGEVSVLLHRAVWEHHNGPIPDGYDIHHGDGNPLNNDIENLECIDRAEHRSEHWRQGDYNTPATRAHQAGFGRRTVAWRQTEQFQEMVKANGVKTWEGREPTERTCLVCGGKYMSRSTRPTFLCSSRCKNKRFASIKAQVFVKCKQCGETKPVCSKRVQFCSLSCAATYRETQRRA